MEISAIASKHLDEMDNHIEHKQQLIGDLSHLEAELERLQSRIQNKTNEIEKSTTEHSTRGHAFLKQCEADGIDLKSQQFIETYKQRFSESRISKFYFSRRTGHQFE